MVCDLDEQIGKRVASIRKRKGMDAQAGADACTLSLYNYMESENGARRFSAHELFELTNLLKVSVSSFFNDNDFKESNGNIVQLCIVDKD